MILTVVLLFLLVFSFYFIFSSHSEVPKDRKKIIVIIANQSNKIHGMSSKQLKGILKGEITQWADNKKVILALMKSNIKAGKITAENILNNFKNAVELGSRAFGFSPEVPPKK